jgi:hypothetical protein
VTRHTAVNVPLHHGKFCMYGVQMEWYEGALYFMRGWEAMVTRLRPRRNE